MPKLISFFIVFFCCHMGFGQVGDCTLGIGGKDNVTLAEVFQLNDDQKAKMEIWTQELSIENKLLQEEIDLLMKTHPQKTEEELMQLAGKYKTLQDKMVANAKSYDIKLLRMFNPKQYKLYTELCAEVMRTPLLGILPE